MRIAVMGAGGVGGYFGARLARAGSEVSFIARGQHAAAMRERGLEIESSTGTTVVKPVTVTDDPATIGPVDVVLFAVKLWDTEPAAHSVLPLLGPETAVISFQNGVQKDDALRAVFGEEHIVGGVAYIGTTIARPGTIRHTGTMQRLVFGEYDGRRSPRVEALYQACRAAGIEAAVSPDIQREIWEKFVFLVGLSAATTTTRRPIGPIRSHPGARKLLLDVMHEAVAVGQACRVNLAEGFAENRLAFCDTLPAEMTSSMHHDLERGTRLEVDWLSGAVVQLGKEHSVPAPVNEVVCEVLALHAGGRTESV